MSMIKYGVDLPASTKIGPGFKIEHLNGIVVNFKIDLVDPADTRRSMAAEMVRDVPLLLFSMRTDSIGQLHPKEDDIFL